MYGRGVSHASAPKEPQRIAKLLARAGIASRREIERMIADGRIAIDGKALDTPATLVVSLHGVTVDGNPVEAPRSEEHTSELQSLMRISYAVFCLNKKTNNKTQQ